MWKKNNETTTPVAKSNIRRLHLDKKENCPALPQIRLKDEKPIKEIEKQEKNSLKAENSKKKFSLNHKHNTVVPFLVNIQNENGNSYRSLDKVRSQSDSLLKERPRMSRKESESRIRIMSKNINGEKEKKSELHLEEHKYQNENISESDMNSDKRKEKKISIDHEPHFDWFSTSHNTIFEDTVENPVEEEVKKEPKQFQNVGVETDLQMNTETFKDFIKFKITQKEKYQKLQEIFEFVDNIAHKEISNFTERYQKVKQLSQEPLETVREQEINHIIQSVELNETRFLNFMDIFITKITKVKKNQITENITQVHHVKEQLHQLKKEINKFFELKENTTILKNIEPFTPKNEITPKKSGRFEKTPLKTNRNEPQNRNFLSLEIHEKFSNITNYLTGLEMKIKSDEEEMTTKLNENREEFKQLFETWKFNLEEKNYAIQVCVGDILRLPEMSLSIFGMNRDDDNKEERDILKKIGVFLDNIPEFDEFYSNSNKKKHQDFCFKEVLDFKCLNCAYLKSKMRFIYSKNKELESVVKILNHLVGHQKELKS